MFPGKKQRAAQIIADDVSVVDSERPPCVT